MWAPIVDALTAWLEAELATAEVVKGASASTPERRTVVVSMGQRMPGQGRNRRGEFTVYVECWEYSADADWGVGNGLLAQLEAEVEAAVHAFGQQRLPVAGYRVHATPERIEPDGDLFRPSVGSRMVVRVQWSTA